MKLQDLLYKVNILKLIGSTNIEISDVQFDSRKIQKKGLFIAIKGTISWTPIHSKHYKRWRNCNYC